MLREDQSLTSLSLCGSLREWHRDVHDGDSGLPAVFRVDSCPSLGAAPGEGEECLMKKA